MMTSTNRRQLWASLLLLQLCSVLSENLRTLNVTDWWEKAGFYQIYPRSYKDSNGDGIGDLNGITEKLPYIKSIGMKAFWLSPIYRSPMADFGYDIADFRDIQPEYGTMQDFERMVAEAKKLDLKVILDFVPNHSSDEHQWFKNSENRIPGYEDYYVWHDGVEGSNPDQKDPPNNWVEAFRGSAWKWSTVRQQYYLHQFHYKQPDLNYRNPAVVEEMKNVLRFWLGKGVAGFRVDAVPWLFEDVNLRDEPKSGNSEDPLLPAYLNHVYTQDLPETVDMVYQWRQVLDDYMMQNGGDTRVLMTEAWSNLSVVSTYFHDANGRKGSHMPFNFQLIMRLDQNSKAADYKTVIDSWLDTVPNAHAPNWVLGNHDKRRVASRMGGEHMADLMALVELSMPGVSVTYQGEEIGMTDYELSWAESKDPAACQTSPEVYQQYTRDPARTPFQWDASTFAGFSNVTPWLPVSPTRATTNVDSEEKADESHLKVFKLLMELRDKDDFHNSQYATAVLGENVFAILRIGAAVADPVPYITLVNLANAAQTVNARELFTKFNTRSYENLVVLVASVNSSRSVGDSVAPDNVAMQPYEGMVLTAAATHILSSLLLPLMAVVLLCLLR